MASRYRLFVTDLDGTLLDERGQIHQEDRAALLELQRRGTHVAIATGRMYSGTRHIARELGLTGPVACLDGSRVVHAGTDRELAGHLMDVEHTAELMATVGQSGASAFVFADDTVFHDERGTPFLSYVRTWSPEMRAVDDVARHDRWARERCVHAVVAVGSEYEIRSAARSVASRPLEAVTFALRRPGLHGRWGMVVRNAGITKGTAIAFIAESHGATLAETVVVGDWLNDAPMMRVAGRAFAMAQAPDEVKRAASDVLERDSLRGGGVHEAARRAGLLD